MTVAFRAGWPLIAALGATQIIGYGSVFYSFSPLMQPLQDSLGATKSVVVAAFSLALVTAATCAVFVGKAIDRNGGRRVMAAGSLAAGLLLASLAHVETAVGLYLVYAGLGAAMSAILYEPAFAVLTQAFGTSARKAITALTLIAGFASTIFWPLSQYLVQTLGWRDAVLVLGGFNLLVCLPLHLMVLPPRAQTAEPAAPAPKRLILSSDLSQALRSPVFHAFAGALVCNGLIFATMSVHIIPLLESKGVSALEAAGLAAMIGPMQVAGRVLEATVGRRFPIAGVGLAALGAMPLALLLLVAAGQGPWLIVAFAMLYGASNGVFTIVRGALPAELFGRDHYGAINGALSAPYLVSHALGPLVGALVWASFGGSYDGMLLVLAVISGTGFCLYGVAMRLHRRRAIDPDETSGTG